jgi:hypothetical protein
VAEEERLAKVAEEERLAKVAEEERLKTQLNDIDRRIQIVTGTLHERREQLVSLKKAGEELEKRKATALEEAARKRQREQAEALEQEKKVERGKEERKERRAIQARLQAEKLEAEAKAAADEAETKAAAEAAEKAEKERLAKVAEEERLAKVAEEERLAKVAEEERLAKVAEEERLAKVAEEERLAKVAEEARIAGATKGKSASDRSALHWSRFTPTRLNSSLSPVPEQADNSSLRISALRFETPATPFTSSPSRESQSPFSLPFSPSSAFPRSPAPSSSRSPAPAPSFSRSPAPAPFSPPSLLTNTSQRLPTTPNSSTTATQPRPSEFRRRNLSALSAAKVAADEAAAKAAAKVAAAKVVAAKVAADEAAAKVVAEKKARKATAAKVKLEEAAAAKVRLEEEAAAKVKLEEDEEAERVRKLKEEAAGKQGVVHKALGALGVLGLGALGALNPELQDVVGNRKPLEVDNTRATVPYDYSQDSSSAVVNAEAARVPAEEARIAEALEVDNTRAVVPYDHSQDSSPAMSPIFQLPILESQNDEFLRGRHISVSDGTSSTVAPKFLPGTSVADRALKDAVHKSIQIKESVEKTRLAVVPYEDGFPKVSSAAEPPIFQEPERDVVVQDSLREQAQAGGGTSDFVSGYSAEAALAPKFLPGTSGADRALPDAVDKSIQMEPPAEEVRVVSLRGEQAQAGGGTSDFVSGYSAEAAVAPKSVLGTSGADRALRYAVDERIQMEASAEKVRLAAFTPPPESSREHSGGQDILEVDNTRAVVPYDYLQDSSSAVVNERAVVPYEGGFPEVSSAVVGDGETALPVSPIFQQPKQDVILSRVVQDSLREQAQAGGGTSNIVSEYSAKAALAESSGGQQEVADMKGNVSMAPSHITGTNLNKPNLSEGQSGIMSLTGQGIMGGEFEKVADVEVEEGVEGEAGEAVVAVEGVKSEPSMLQQVGDQIVQFAAQNPNWALAAGVAATLGTTYLLYKMYKSWKTGGMGREAPGKGESQVAVTWELRGSVLEWDGDMTVHALRLGLLGGDSRSIARHLVELETGAPVASYVNSPNRLAAEGNVEEERRFVAQWAKEKLAAGGYAWHVEELGYVPETKAGGGWLFGSKRPAVPAFWRIGVCADTHASELYGEVVLRRQMRDLVSRNPIALKGGIEKRTFEGLYGQYCGAAAQADFYTFEEASLRSGAPFEIPASLPSPSSSLRWTDKKGKYEFQSVGFVARLGEDDVYFEAQIPMGRVGAAGDDVAFSEADYVASCNFLLAPLAGGDSVSACYASSYGEEKYMKDISQEGPAVRLVPLGPFAQAAGGATPEDTRRILLSREMKFKREVLRAFFVNGGGLCAKASIPGAYFAFKENQDAAAYLGGVRDGKRARATPPTVAFEQILKTEEQKRNKRV